MIKHTNFQFVHVNLYPRVACEAQRKCVCASQANPRVVLALILGLNNYHLVVMCRADVADAVEVQLYYRFHFRLFSHSGKSRSRLLKKRFFAKISHVLTEAITDKTETTSGCFPDDILRTYHLINSIITSAFPRHENSVIPKLTNFNFNFTDYFGSVNGILCQFILYLKSTKVNKPKLPLFNQVYQWFMH